MCETTLVLLVMTTPVITRDSVSQPSGSQFVFADRVSEESIADRRTLDNQETRDVRVDLHLHPEHQALVNCLHHGFCLQE